MNQHPEKARTQPRALIKPLHPAKSTYLFPARALSRHLRGGFVSRLRHAYEAGALSRLSGRAEVDRVLKALMATDWVVYSKPCLARTETVVDYLGRYSHRIALADSRLSDFDGQSLNLSYKDYRDGDRRKVMTLTGEELLRRYLLLEFRVQLWEERAKWLAGHKRPLRKARIEAYRQVLRSGLRG